MIYARVPAFEGLPLVGTVRLLLGTSLSDTEALVVIEGEMQDGWVELTEAEYIALGGVIPTPQPEVLTAEQRIANLETIIDTLLGGGV